MNVIAAVVNACGVSKRCTRMRYLVLFGPPFFMAGFEFSHMSFDVCFLRHYFLRQTIKKTRVREKNAPHLVSKR
eukprot:SAG11_NODE_843_length_6892_cov_31.379803_4_plen_74_part_00